MKIIDEMTFNTLGFRHIWEEKNPPLEFKKNHRYRTVWSRWGLFKGNGFIATDWWSCHARRFVMLRWGEWTALAISKSMRSNRILNTCIHEMIIIICCLWVQENIRFLIGRMRIRTWFGYGAYLTYKVFTKVTYIVLG